jgi:hypothetical protein
LSFSLPTSIPETKIRAQLQLRLYGNSQFYSYNEYDINISDMDYAKVSSSITVAYFGEDESLVSLMASKGVQVSRLSSLYDIPYGSWNAIVVGKLRERPEGYEQLVSYMNMGGHVLLHDNGNLVVELFPDQIHDYKSKPMGIVTPQDYGRSIFDGIDPTDLSWFFQSENLPGSPKPGYVPYAANGIYNIWYSDDVLVLAESTAIHGYLETVSSQELVDKPGTMPNVDVYRNSKSFDELHGYPLFQVKKGNGAAIISSMLFEADQDPIANKLLINVLEYLSTKQAQAMVPAPSTPAPPVPSSLRPPPSTTMSSSGYSAALSTLGVTATMLSSFFSIILVQRVIAL